MAVCCCEGQGCMAVIGFLVDFDRVFFYEVDEGLGVAVHGCLVKDGVAIYVFLMVVGMACFDEVGDDMGVSVTCCAVKDGLFEFIGFVDIDGIGVVKVFHCLQVALGGGV